MAVRKEANASLSREAQKTDLLFTEIEEWRDWATRSLTQFESDLGARMTHKGVNAVDQKNINQVLRHVTALQETLKPLAKTLQPKRRSKSKG